MNEAAVLLKRLSDHVEVEKTNNKSRESVCDVGTRGYASLGQVTMLDMGSYLLNLVVRLIEVEAQEKLRGVELQLQDNSELSTAEKDRIFTEQATKSADAVVLQLRSLPTNCVFEETRKKIETIVNLKLKPIS